MAGPGHGRLIRYRGLSAVRSGVFPGHRRASGAKGCVLTTHPDQRTDATPWPPARMPPTDKAMRLPVLMPFLVGVAVLHRTLPAVLGYDPTTGQALPSSPTDLQRGRLVQRHPHSERLLGLVLDRRVPKSQLHTERLGWSVVEVIYDRAGWDATNAGVANLWTGRLHRHLRRWCRAVLGACGSATPEGVPCRAQAG